MQLKKQTAAPIYNWGKKKKKKVHSMDVNCLANGYVAAAANRSSWNREALSVQIYSL